MTKTFKFVSMLMAAVVICSGANAQVTKDSLDQHADQAQGNYAATNLNYLGSGSLGMMQSAWKDPLQHMGEGQTRPGYSKYYWTPELVLPVRLREGMYTLINFPKWEVIENVFLGDSVSFDAQIEGPSSLMVYPNASQFVGVDTNMIVFGRSGNKYVFYVQSETVNTDRITNSIIDIEVVKKSPGSNNYATGYGHNGGGNGYSTDSNSVDSNYTRDMQKEDWIEKIPVDPTKFRFDIEVYVPNPDDIIIAPERVWRDNIFTYIDLGEKALTAVQRPIVTLIVERSETPVGFRSAGPNNRLIIVEGMGDMVLRSGKRLVCLKLRRADSDGLENTVYAKSNEWDLQTSYASKPEYTSGSNDSMYEDVYGAGNGQNSAKGLSPANSESFFNSNSFSNNSGQGANAGVGAGTNAGANGWQGSANASNINGNNGANAADMGKDMGYGNPTATGGNGVPQGINGTTGGTNGYQGQNTLANNQSGNVGQSTTNPALQGNGSMARGQGLDSLPRVTPVVAGQAPQNASGTAPELSGQYDVRVGSSELITPDYNNANVNVGVTYQPDKNNGQITDEMLKAAQLGNSKNNSNPVLISQSDSAISNKATAISAETEALLQEFRSGKAFENSKESNISIELGTDENVNNLEKLWNSLSKRYSATIGKYQPFYSVDAPADGQGKDVFHLRVGPVKSLEEGDNVCSGLGRNGIFCSVVRIQ